MNLKTISVLIQTYIPIKYILTFGIGLIMAFLLTTSYGMYCTRPKIENKKVEQYGPNRYDGILEYIEGLNE